MKTLLVNVLRSLGRASVILQGVEVERNVMVHGFPWIRNKGGRIVFEDDVTINAATWANPLVATRTSLFCGSDAELRLARGSGISSSQIIAHTGILIGERSLVGAGCLICDSDMHEVPLRGGGQIQSAPIRIGNDVFIGARSMILKGVTIGDGAIVGAGSVVSSDVPSGGKVVSAPLRSFAPNQETLYN